MKNMQHSSKLILVEGIPGSGKTTITGKMEKWYHDNGVPIRLYNEGIANPIDLAWCAYVPLKQYHELLKKYESISDRIKERSVVEGDYVVVEYTQVHRGKSFYDELQNYELYGGRVSDDRYFEITMSRWRAFGNSSPAELSIIESAFLQNTVMELLFYRCLDESVIISHANKLIEYVKDLNPIVIYLSPTDVRKTIQHIADERSSPNGKWIDDMIAYCEKTQYAKRHNITGFDGVITMLEKRKQLERTILNSLPIRSIIIENRGNDWDGVWREVVGFIECS